MTLYFILLVWRIVPSIENPIRYFENNVIGTSKALEASKKASVKKFVYAASSSCYGIAKTPTSETHKINPLYPYAMSKYLGENFVFIGINFINFQLIQLEYLMLMDQELKQQVFMELFLVFFKQKLENKPLTIVGNGNQKEILLM